MTILNKIGKSIVKSGVVSDDVKNETIVSDKMKMFVSLFLSFSMCRHGPSGRQAVLQTVNMTTTRLQQRQQTGATSCVYDLVVGT